jgi:hypothetical protein
MTTNDTIEPTTVLLPAKLRRQAQDLARERDDRSLSSLIRSMLRDYVAQSQRQMST